MVGRAAFVGETESGHKTTIDGPDDGEGGRNLGPRPTMETVLLGMGACASYDTVSILKKTRQNVTDCTIELQAERANEIPSVFTEIHVHFKVTGIDLIEKYVERAINLFAEKYCSASIMLGKAAKTSHFFEINKPPGN